MARDGLPRAYLRMDPNLDQHPDADGMMRLMCAAARQPYRGRFKFRNTIVTIVGESRTRAMLARRDVIKLADGTLYLDGWDEWQEGDLTVAERMRRMRERRRENRNGVTPRSRRQRNGVTTDATREELERSSSSRVGVGEEIPPPPAERGRRSDGTNLRAVGESPRQTGSNPRANGESPRQEREAEKTGPTALREVMAAIAAGKP
jgi:hypothetical protein